MRRQLIATALIVSAMLPAGAQNAIVEESLTEVHVASAVKATTHRREVTTIQNEKGADHAFFLCACSKDERLTDFRGQVTDASGRVLRKFRQGDLKRTEYSEYLAIDDYKLYLEYTPPVYPVTITYEWTMDSHQTLIEYPMFCPQDAYDVSVKKAVYQLTAPQDITIRHALKNLVQLPQKTTDEKGRQVLTLEVANLPALREEPFARPLRERIPMAYFAPQHFVYYGTQGSLASWEDFGRWKYSLLKGRDQLPATVKSELHQLTDALPTEREKVEALYHYMETHTRYVAVLLGIGGLQPAPAAEVAKSGFGDCKGLSNLMRAMLQEVGIASNYTAISTYNRQFVRDFPSAGQMNHVILQVPLKEDTLWLECTNPQLPFGYVHEDIAGHDALLVNETGGRLVTLPTYADTLNSQRSTVSLDLSADGHADITLQQVSRNRQYERRIPLLNMSEKDRLRMMRQLMHLPQCTFGKTDVSQGEGASIRLDVACRSVGYANQTGQRLFVPLCPIRQHYSAPATIGERTEPLYIGMGFLDEDEVTITLPAGYVVEAQPKGMVVEKPFGSFAFQVAVRDGKIRVMYRVHVKSGSYAPALYAEFSAFVKSISNAYGQKLVLRKES